jgi:hypothetical protein
MVRVGLLERGMSDSPLEKVPNVDFANRSWRSFGSLIRPGSFRESKARDVSKKIPGTTMACHASVDFAVFGSTSQ